MYVRSDTAGYAVTINPATGEQIASHPFHNETEVEAILAAAAAGHAVWRRIPIEARAQMLRQLGAILRDEVESFAARITREMGKPITQARAEVRKCALLCDWYAAHGPAFLADETVDMGTDSAALILRDPIGPVLAVMPWNFPLWQVLRAAVPILLAGNALLLKHADNVQGSAWALADALSRAGLAIGAFAVLNVDRAAITSLIADPRIAAVTVTAGVAAGSAIAATAGAHLKKSVLELGGSDPFIVLADADLDRAIDAAVEARFQNCGQVCIASKRFIVEAPVFDAFVSGFANRARLLISGDPASEDTRLGPMARGSLRDELHAQISASIVMGARAISGGEMPDGPGFYYPPSILLDITPDMPIWREETFGPVAPIISAQHAEQALSIANASNYGLAASIWSRDIERATILARELETGGVFVNDVPASDPRTPIGGVKQSGFGRELSYFGMHEFTNVKLVRVRSWSGLS